MTFIFILLFLATSNGFSMLPGRKPALTVAMTQTTTPGVIIGGGRIGNLLYESNGKQDTFLDKRGMQIPDTPGPIYICTRNNDLDDIIERTPNGKRKDLVFLQNGMLAPYLEAKGLGGNTQVGGSSIPRT